VFRLAVSEQLIVAAPHDPIAEAHRGPTQLAHAGLDDHLVVIAGGAQVAAARLEHRQPHALGLDLAIAAAQRAQHLGSTDLEPAEVVPVVREPHLIGVAIANANREAVHT